MVLLRYKDASIFVVSALNINKLMQCHGSTFLSNASSSDKVLGAGSASTKVLSLLLSDSDSRATIPEKEKKSMQHIALFIILNITVSFFIINLEHHTFSARGLHKYPADSVPN
jgi:hypothetical protein